MTKNEYLRKLCIALPPLPRRRRQIVAEVSDHLECAVAAECREGANRADAEERACAKLGSPSQLAAEFAADLRARSIGATSRILAVALAAWFGSSVLSFFEYEVLHHRGHARLLWRGVPLFGQSFHAYETAFALRLGSIALVALLLLAAAVRERRPLRIAAGLCAVLPLFHETLTVVTSLGWQPSLQVWYGETAVGLAGALALAVTSPRRDGLERDGIAAGLAVVGALALLVAATLRATSGLVVPLDPLTALGLTSVLIVPLGLFAFLAGCRTLLTLRRPEAAD
jgi:HAAS